MKKGIEVTNEVLLKRNRELRTRYTSSLVKWYQTNMSKEDKYRFGLLTYEEFEEWQRELAEEAARREAEEKEAAERAAQQPEPAPEYKTFWEGDEGDRENISEDDYAKFLAENNINVSNSTAVDLNSLMNDNS